MRKNHSNSNLDSLLESEGQQAVRSVLKAMPEDSLSLAWRSELNEKLMKVQPKSRAWFRFHRAWQPVLGMALAGCLAMVVMLRQTTPEQPAQPRHNLEAAMVQVYDDSSGLDDLTGPGLSAHEVADTTRSVDSSNSWTETDLNTL